MTPRYPSRITDTPIRVSEQAIDAYGPKAIAMYAFVAIRAINGAVYPYDGRVLERFGWSRSKFYKSMGLLVKNGLAVRQLDSGNWILKDRNEVSQVKHRCHLLITRKNTERQVLDMVFLKLVEMGHRQVSRSILPKNTTKGFAKQERVRLLMNGVKLANDPTVLFVQPPLLGEGQDKVVKRVKDGYAPMNTDKLMALTGLGRMALFAWKKRVKAAKLIKQVDRSWRIPLKVAIGLPEFTEGLERTFKGRVSQSSDGCHYFHQASCYKLMIQYGG